MTKQEALALAHACEDRAKWDTVIDPLKLLTEAAKAIRDLAAQQDGADPVAWRVLVTKNGKTYNEYTERLPFEPDEGSGVKVRSEPQPLYLARLEQIVSALP